MVKGEARITRRCDEHDVYKRDHSFTRKLPLVKISVVYRIFETHSYSSNAFNIVIDSLRPVEIEMSSFIRLTSLALVALVGVVSADFHVWYGIVSGYGIDQTPTFYFLNDDNPSW